MPRPAMPIQPEALQGLQCGATTRAGTPCKLTGLYKSGRCKLHGGMSTGPKTDAGREQSRINGAKGGRRATRVHERRGKAHFGVTAGSLLGCQVVDGLHKA